MRVVIDSNRIQSLELESFLGSGRSHRAVVTDWLMMEAYKGETTKSIYKSLGILAKYPRQVVVLKNTGQCMHQGVGPQMANSLIWRDLTETFPGFIGEVAAASAGDKAIQDSLLWRGQQADKRMQELLDATEHLMDGNDVMLKSLTPEDVRAIRSGSEVPQDILNRIFQIARSVAEGFRRGLENPAPAPTGKEYKQDFLFRVGLAVTSSFLEWVRLGSPRTAKPEKVRNDYVDTMLSVYGTYFNGIMTGDAKLQRIHTLNRQLLALAKVALPRPYSNSE